MNSPVTLLNRRTLVPERRTAVVLGLYRGGTSMVAGVLRSLGVFMGDRIDPRNNHEDLDFQGAGAEKIRECIAKRNIAHDVWGWKDPGSLFSFADWRAHVRNPYFLFVFRDGLAAAQTEIRAAQFTDVLATLRMKQEHTNLLFHAVEEAVESGAPVMLVSYERAIHDRSEFVRELTEWFGLDASRADLSRASTWIDPTLGYREALVRDEPAAHSTD